MNQPKEVPEKCAMCDREAIREYEDEPSCGRVKCELEIQAAKDYHEERDWQ